MNRYVSKVKEFLALEALAIEKASKKLAEAEIEKVLEILSSCKGKIVLFGIGKSGDVARKVAATFASTGTVAIALHPVDAMHGDLGVIVAGDIAIAISNSGETDELIAVLASLKRRKIPIIAIVGNARSTLAQNADALLDASVEREACPFNLAPTASTTVAMGIGDALAMVLMEMKGRSPHDFAQNHPAGRLGKRLTLRIEDLMHRGDCNPTLVKEATWYDVVSKITSGGLGVVSIVNERGQLIGIITDGDLRRTVQKTSPDKLMDLSADTMMTKNPISVGPDVLAYEALKLMENRPSPISVLPVVTTDKMCVGVIRLHDLIRSGLE